MTKPELARRLATIPHDVAMRAYKAILDGYGRLDLEFPVTVKQANALHEWHNRYGRIYPSASDCAPDASLPKINLFEKSLALWA